MDVYTGNYDSLTKPVQSVRLFKVHIYR